MIISSHKIAKRIHATLSDAGSGTAKHFHRTTIIFASQLFALMIGAEIGQNQPKRRNSNPRKEKTDPSQHIPVTGE